MFGPPLEDTRVRDTEKREQRRSPLTREEVSRIVKESCECDVVTLFSSKVVELLNIDMPGRILGRSATPRQDHHATQIENIEMSSKASDETHAALEPKAKDCVASHVLCRENSP